MRKLLSILIGLVALTANAQKADKHDQISVIPRPQYFEQIPEQQRHTFTINAKTVITYPKGDTQMQRNAEFLSEFLAQSFGYKLATKEANGNEKNNISLSLGNDIANEEGYEMTSDANCIRITGRTPRGVFYGIQTLRKSVPAIVEGDTYEFPAVNIKDEPRFKHRAMHLDVCRHFFPLEFVKKYIDILAMHNLNTLHWHLTDDQGWRIEIKKYPKLTEVGSMRQRTVIGYLGSGKYEYADYGGYYTQDQLREMVEYAKERYINIIPEVDLPGHMLAALASYPELGCTGGPYEVCPDWGVFEDVLCIGNEKVIPFLEDVLTEVMDIFPSEYIHIGGDEVPRTRWKACPKCQALIKEKGFKAQNGFEAEDFLQSYCMKEIEDFLNEHNRKAIGWDEILNGEAAPNVTVMSWQGTEGGIKAAKSGHDIIMAPNTHCYFDFYQTGDTKDEPLAIGGCIPVEKVYGFEPTKGLNKEEATHVIGLQANIWTEYIATTDHVEYMLLPRLAALAEVQWTNPERKKYKDFTKRLRSLIKFYDRDSLTYGKHILNIKADFVPSKEKKAIMAELSTIDEAPIHYTIDGSEPNEQSSLYTKPVAITGSCTFRAVAFRNSEKSKEVEKKIDFNKATLADISFPGLKPTPKYTFNGAPTLVDGITGNDNFSTGAWLGFLGDEATILIDLGAEKEINKVAVRSMVYMDAWIMGISGLKVETSNDNASYAKVAEDTYPEDTDIKKRSIETFTAEFSTTKARFLKLTVKASSGMPTGHTGEGDSAFFFLDEIMVF